MHLKKKREKQRGNPKPQVTKRVLVSYNLL